MNGIRRVRLASMNSVANLAIICQIVAFIKELLFRSTDFAIFSQLLLLRDGILWNLGSFWASCIRCWRKALCGTVFSYASCKLCNKTISLSCDLWACKKNNVARFRGGCLIQRNVRSSHGNECEDFECRITTKKRPTDLVIKRISLALDGFRPVLILKTIRRIN